MEKRVFLAILLSFVVLMVYQTYFAPPPPVPATTAVESSAAPAAGAGATTTAPAGTPTPASSPAAPGQTATASQPAAPIGQPLVGDTEARDVVVDTAGVHAVFSTRGGVLKSWKLKQYLQSGEPLDLVPPNLPPEYPAPFTLATDDAKQSALLANALYQPSATSLALDRNQGTLTFQYRDASGLNARKTFYFQPDGHPFQVNVEAAVDLNGAALPVVIQWGPALALGYSPEGSRYQPPRALVFRDGSLTRLTGAKVQEQPTLDGAMRFVGVEDHYFLSVAVPREQQVRAEFHPVTLPLDQKTSRQFIAYSVRVNPGAAPSGATAIPFVMGPKDFDKLRAVDPQLVRAIDFGMFAFLVVPLLQALKWINGFVHNYGWSIIILTVLINLAIFPLRHRSMVSMRRMQALQPEVKAIQDRYAKYKVTDPERQKMNQEMLALYKQKGVNPASGCVPMLLTLPILFAFYALLAAAIELRGAPFIGWIHDLASPDPIYVTPVIMGATMLWQQLMMPSTADPMQQKMFLLMPLIFTFMFLAAPAGLVIYWLMSNLLAIGQQYLTNRIIGAPPGAKPLIRSVGKGRTAAAGGGRGE